MTFLHCCRSLTPQPPVCLPSLRTPAGGPNPGGSNPDDPWSRLLDLLLVPKLHSLSFFECMSSGSTFMDQLARTLLSFTRIVYIPS
ncbi:hypothetical protein L218DRAFT_408399 [Marasmius fiardii PR-910]|nr:hypothetical protein L218DRAFT_408399 [Marasmius fiardii PR-910]